MQIIAAARSSNLSRAQFREVEALFPQFQWEPIWMKSFGDLDKKTSLRDLEKTNFFTKELDEMVLCGGARVAIHSAKDLPEPLPFGLFVARLTEGLDPRDSIVFARGDTLAPNAIVATSSVRREELVRTKWPECRFVDVRGTIEERLALLGNKADAVVVAEAALIRLGLTHLPRYIFSEKIAPLQGKLAIVGRVDDVELTSLFL